MSPLLKFLIYFILVSIVCLYVEYRGYTSIADCLFMLCGWFPLLIQRAKDELAK